MQTAAFTRKNPDPKTKDISQKRCSEKVKTTLSVWDRMARPIVPRGWAPEMRPYHRNTFWWDWKLERRTNKKEIFSFMGAIGPQKAQDGSAGRPVGLTGTFRSHPARGTAPSKVSPFEKITRLFSAKRQGLGCVVIYW